MLDALPRPVLSRTILTRAAVWRRPAIRPYTLVVSIAVAVAILAIGLFIAYASQQRRATERNAAAASTSYAQLFAEHARRVFDAGHLATIMGMTLAADRPWDEIERSRDNHEYLRRLPENFEYLDGVWLIDASGRPRLTSRSFPAPLLNQSFNDYFRAQRDGDAGPYIGTLSTTDGGRADIVISRRLNDPDGTFRGIAMTLINAEYFRQFYASVRHPDEVVIEMFRADLQRILRYPASVPGATTTARPRLESAVKIDGLPVYVSAAITDETVQRRWRADLRMPAAAAVMAVTVILLLTGIALRRCRREEEAGAALRDLNATLEGRVRERTQELEKTGERLSHLLEQKETLLREIVHRVKNSLQLACALLRLQGRASGNDVVASQLDEAAIRIASIAQVHNRLYQSPDVRTVSVTSYVAALCHDLETSLAVADRQITVECAIDPIEGSPDRVVLLGVIVTELVTNAFKFAFRGRAAGRIRVEVRRASEGPVRVVVSDDGIGATAPDAEATGFSSHMVRGLLDQLDGTMVVRADDNGTRVELSIKGLGGAA